MARLIYSAIASLDGYVADPDGNFDWAAPDDEVHAYVNDLERSVGTYLYGRRMYETMVYWETAHAVAGQHPVALDFARVWQAADKVVYSRTLDAVSSAKTRIERTFDVDAVQRMKEIATADVTVGGPELGGQALGAGLVDDVHFFAVPIIVGAGNPAFPSNARVPLELVDERRFKSGFVHLHYRTR